MQLFRCLATNLIYAWSLVIYIILHMVFKYCMIAVHGVAIH